MKEGKRVIIELSSSRAAVQTDLVRIPARLAVSARGKGVSFAHRNKKASRGAWLFRGQGLNSRPYLWKMCVGDTFSNTVIIAGSK
jgi:hypothetical protein